MLSWCKNSMVWKLNHIWIWTRSPQNATQKRCNNKKAVKANKTDTKKCNIFSFIFLHFYTFLFFRLHTNPPQPTHSATLPRSAHCTTPKKSFPSAIFRSHKKKLSYPSFCRFIQRTLFCAIFVCSGKMTRKYSRVCSLHHTVSVSTVSSKIIYPKTYSYRDNLLQQKFYKLFQQRLIIY